MPAHLLLFDDLGNLWDGSSPRLRDSFGSTAATDDFSTYVVMNMGFVAVHGYGRSCEIRLRPRLVTPATFGALQAWLAERKFDRIVTACFDADWVYGLFPSQEAAVAKLVAMLSTAQRARPGDYLSRALAKEDLPRTTPLHQALHSLIDNWPMLSQAVHRDGLMNIVRRSLQGRYHIMVADEGQGRLMFGEIGAGFASYSEDWRRQAIGKSISEHEDASYGKWLADCCHKVLASGEVAISDVDAIIQAPKIGRARIRYKRLLLPVRGAGRGMWLLTSSYIDPTIDLRVELLKKTG
jgi:hypothetical protein